MTRRTDEGLNFFLAQLRAIVERSQHDWEESEHEAERWFSRLRLTSIAIDQDKATFLFVDDTDGRRYGFRWWLWYEDGEDALVDPDEALMLFDVHLEEHVAGCELTAGWTYRASPPDRDGVQWIGEDRPPPNTELGDLEGRLSHVIFGYQAAWTDSEYEPERQFSRLKLISSSIDWDAARFVLADQAGHSYGYRWRIRNDATTDPDRAASMFAAHLREDVRRLGHGEPDADGIRWFGQETPTI